MEMDRDTDASAFCLRLVRTQHTVLRKLDAALGEQHGLGFGDFILLRHLAAAPGGTLPRHELATRVGATVYGVTQSLVPLEKIGLVTRGGAQGSVRIGDAAITAAGQQLVAHAGTTAREACAALLDPTMLATLAPLVEVLDSIEQACA